MWKTTFSCPRSGERSAPRVAKPAIVRSGVTGGGVGQSDRGPALVLEAGQVLPLLRGRDRAACREVAAQGLQSPALVGDSPAGAKTETAHQSQAGCPPD